MSQLRTMIAAFALLATTPAAADDLADEADFLFRRGTEAYRRGDYAGALERFLASNRLVQNHNVMFNIAYTYDKLGSFPEAYHYFSLALERERDPEQAARIRAELARLARKVALLIVETTPPGATLYWERKDLGPRGESPRTFGLAPGPRTLLVELDGYHPERVDIPEIAAGEQRRIHVALRPVLGHVSVEAPAGTSVRVSGASDGPACDAPCKLSLPPGIARLVFSRPGYRPLELSVRVTPDAVERVAPELSPEQGRLVIRSDEPGVEVAVGDRTVGFTPAVVVLPVGTHEVRLTREGYRSERRTVSIAADRSTTLYVVLKEEEEVTAASRVRERVEEAPSSVTLVPRVELEAFRYPTIAEALRGVPGVYVWDDRAYATVGFRGMSLLGNYGNRVLVLLDGHPLNDNWLGSSYVGYEGRTDLGAVDRIEVVRGPGSVVYGTSAFSGVINLVSRPVASVPKTRVGVGTEGTGVARVRVRSDAPFAQGGGIWAQASVARSGGQDYYFPELADEAPASAAGHARGIDGFDAATLEGQLSWKALSARWFWHVHDKVIPSAPYNTLVGDARMRQRDTRASLELRAEPRLSRAVSSLTRVHLNHYRYRGVYPRDASEHGLQHERFQGSWVGLEQRFEIVPTPGLRLLAGGELQSHFQVEQWAVDESRVLLDDTGSAGHPFWLGAAYATADVALAEPVTLHGGARLDAYSTFGASLNPRVSLIARPYPGGNVKLVGATAFRAPSVYELYYNDAGITQVASPDLGPERIYSLELEMSHEFSPLVTGSITVFGNYVTELVTTRGSGTGDDPLHYQNSDVPLATLGGEVTVRRDLRNGVLLSASYGLLQARYIRDASVRSLLAFEPHDPTVHVENVPNHLATLKGIFPFYGRALRLASRLTFETGRYDRAEGSDPDERVAQKRTSPVAVLDLVLTGQDARTGLDWAFGLYNVFDYRYSLPASAEFRQRTIPQAGRTLLLSLDATFH